jgi:hypothetical protein
VREIPFAIAITGVVHVNESSITVTVNKTETVVSMEPEAKGKGRVSLEEGKTLFDVALEAARDVVRQKRSNRFRAAEVYHRALERYPELKRNSFTGHVIASAPDHPSYKHFSARRNYFAYSGGGEYRLNREYVPEEVKAL